MVRARGIANRGYSSDLTMAWMVNDLGPEWVRWQQYAAEWMSTQNKGLSPKLGGLKNLFLYLKNCAPYASDLALFFTGDSSGHKVSSYEFEAYLKYQGSNTDFENYRHITTAIHLVNWIIDQHMTAVDDEGQRLPYFDNPFQKTKTPRSPNFETVHNPLPFRYIKQLRQILCPYPTDVDDDKPWIGRHFNDWRWAIEHLQCGNRGWMEVCQNVIDLNDPDCIWRTRKVTRSGEVVNIHEIWSPVMAMFLFTKLHLPLRSYQIRFLDSGEGDTWRYVQGNWVVNNKHSFRYGTPKRPYQKGVFRRIRDSMTESYSTGLYITTNKTADQNKEEVDRGYCIPWQHEELLYWLEKLRNWQEKYNKIDRLTKGSDLRTKHTGSRKSTKQLQEMGEFAFLFRLSGENFPISALAIGNPWYRLLSKLEGDLFKSGHTMANGEHLRLVKFCDDRKEYQKVSTEFSLHSLRVSLITCYSMDTDLPLPVISKLLAGHTRLIMTLYYNKISPSVMAEKMKEASASLAGNEESSLKAFLADAEMNQIQLRTAFQSDNYNSVEAVLANRNPIGWEERATGLCLVGGNTVRSDEQSTVGGCWNGGPIIKDSESVRSRVYGPVPHGPENCIRCRWHISDASYLLALNSKFNQLSYKAHQAAELAVEIEGRLDALKDELFIAEETGDVFLMHSELQALERRYEKQRVEADEYAKDYIATFNLINRVMEIERQREEDDGCQKLVAVGSSEDLNISMKFIETESELLQLSLLCDDAEFYPDLHDDLRKTPAIAKRSNALSRMMSRSGYQPLFLEMDEQTQLIAGNAVMRKMAQIANPADKLEGYRIAANYIEAQEYLKDSRLLDSGFDELGKLTPLTFSADASKRIPLVEVTYD